MNKHIHAGNMAALALLGLIILAACGDSQREDLYLKVHCEMVSIYTQSNGEYGWPDIKDIAKHQCNMEKVLARQKALRAESKDTIDTLSAGKGGE